MIYVGYIDVRKEHITWIFDFYKRKKHFLIDYEFYELYRFMTSIPCIGQDENIWGFNKSSISSNLSARCSGYWHDFIKQSKKLISF